MKVRLRIAADDEQLPPESRAFTCPGCGAPHVVSREETDPPIPKEDPVFRFDFECQSPDCQAGEGGTPYKTALGVG